MKLTYKDVLYYQTSRTLEIEDVPKDDIIANLRGAMNEVEDESEVLEVGNKFRKFLNVAQELDEGNK